MMRGIEWRCEWRWRTCISGAQPCEVVVGSTNGEGEEILPRKVVILGVPHICGG